MNITPIWNEWHIKWEKSFSQLSEMWKYSGISKVTMLWMQSWECMCANEWSHLCGNRMTSAPLPRGGHTAFCVLAGLFPGLPDSYWVGATANRGRVWPLLETFGLRSVSVYIWRFFKKQSTREWSVTDIDRLLKSHYLHFPEWILLRNEWEQCLISSVRHSHTMWNVME